MRFQEFNSRAQKFGLFHFVGIGGIGMSGIASIMHEMGYLVQGSDLSSNANTQRLNNAGIKVFTGHNEQNVSEDVSFLVISTDIPRDNIEILEAYRRGIPVLKRAEMLAEIMRFKTSIAVSGSHGKTTTTSLIATLFEQAKMNPTVINGGIINTKDTNAYLGIGEYIIAEADESDGTFIEIPATIGVITNIDKEHMYYYKSVQNLKDAFTRFIKNLPFYGFAVVCIDDPVVKEVISTIKERRIITYGIEAKNPNIRALNTRMHQTYSLYDLEINLRSLKLTIKDIKIPVVGKHNILNSLAAIAIGIEMNFGLNTMFDGFKNFGGIKRRFSILGQYNGATIVDDYAHHPTEINVTFNAAKNITSGKIIAIVQPHRYSRLLDLLKEFTITLSKIDKVYIMDVFSAGEPSIEGVSAEVLINLINQNSGNAHKLHSKTQLTEIAKNELSNGDILLMMGAGDITKWAHELVKLLLQQ